MIGKFPLKKILILVAILALPGFLYYLLQAKGKNRYKPLPIYGPKMVLKTYHKKRGKLIPDTLFHQITEIKGFNQYNKSATLKKSNNQLKVVHFFYSRNQNLNKIINKNILPLAKEFENNKLVKFVWISVDQSYDTPAVLQKYNIENKTFFNRRWVFITNTATDVFSLAKSDFYVNAHKVSDTEFLVSEKLILIDVENRIRGYYDATNQAAVKQLSDELKVQITEELRKIKAEL